VIRIGLKEAIVKHVIKYKKIGDRDRGGLEDYRSRGYIYRVVKN